MANFVDFNFETIDGPNQALELDYLLRSQYILELFDETVASWPAGAKKLQTQRLVPTIRRSTLDGVFWGKLFGLIFFALYLSLATGTALEAISGKNSDYGIKDSFIKSGREKITEGTSAIFLLTGDSTTNKVVEALNKCPSTNSFRRTC